MQCSVARVRAERRGQISNRKPYSMAGDGVLPAAGKQPHAFNIRLMILRVVSEYQRPMSRR